MSYFRENIDRIDGYTAGFQPAAEAVVKLNTNENPYPPSPRALEAVRKTNAEQLRRYPQPLGDMFRQAASEVLGISADNIICTNGGDDLLTICFRAFCNDNRGAAYPGPTYSLYPVLAGLQGCEGIEVGPDDGKIDIDKLAATPAGLVIVCNPNAPTGSFTQPKRLADLAERLKSKAVLLIDEAYVDFADANCLELVKSCENVIILRSMSKGYSLAGLRFGYGIANKELIAGLIKVKDSYNINTVAVAAATAAIKDQKYFRENIEKINTERTTLTGALRDLGFTVPGSQSNFVLAGIAGAAGIYEKLAAENIYVRYFRLPGLEDKLRITVGTKEQNDKLIEALKEILK